MAKENGIERRVHERHAVDGLKGTFLLNTDARVIDLSLNGMAIETNSPLKVGHGYSLRLSQDDNQVPMRGQVVWCTLIKTARNQEGEILPVYRAGVHFEDVLGNKASELVRFIEQNAIVSVEKRLFGRFRIDPGSSANVSCEAEYTVRQIGTGGMRVSTDTQPPLDSVLEMELFYDEVRLQIRARVAWVKAIDEVQDDAPAGGVEMGVQFTDTDADTRLALEDLAAGRSGGS